MAEENISCAFLRHNAAKHFLCLSYKAVHQRGEPGFGFASCFVVEIEGLWFQIRILEYELFVHDIIIPL